MRTLSCDIQVKNDALNSHITVFYELTVTAITIEDEQYTVYGVRVIQQEELSRKEVVFLDISTHKEIVVGLIEVLQKGTVTIMTVGDIIEDFILDL